MENIWAKYQKGRDYLDKKGLVNKVDRYWNFYLGNQWAGLETGGEELPFENIIKPVCKYKVATVSQNTMTAVYTDMEDRTEFNNVCKLLGKSFSRFWEKAKMDTLAWEVIRAACIEGDNYLYFDSLDITSAQQLSTTQLVFANEQETDIQKQDWIIIYQRRSVKEIREEAKENGIKKSDIELIVGDKNNTHEIGNKTEVDGEEKCDDIIYFTRKDGVVHYAKATKAVEYCPLTPLAATDVNGNQVTSLKLYPIVKFIWERRPNDARGNSEVMQLIPNQIEINKTLARRSISVKMTAFPRIAYDSTAIENPDDLERVGAAIAMNGAAGNIDTMIKYLNPASMSHDAQALLSDLITTTRELAGAGDAAMGNIDPQRASGAAITAVRDQQALPLNEQIAEYKQFAEDLAMLIFDMEVAYNPRGLEVTYEENGQMMTEVISPEQLEELKPSIRIDVSQDNGWTKYAEQQELANHLNAQHITFEEYVDLLPEGSPLPVNKMQAIINKRKEQQAMMPPQQGMPANIGEL